MHDVIPRLNAKERKRSLGWLAWWWIETFCVVGSEPAYDLPVREAPEYIQFYVDAYALDRTGRRRFEHVFLSRPKGCDKSGKAARIGLFEALGPCRFAGWAKGGETYEFLGETYVYEPDEPMGRPIQGPNIVCIATSEDQSSNVYSVMKYNCENGPLSQLRGYGLDVGETRILLPEGGSIKPGATSASSHDGGKQTFLIADETHLDVLPRLKGTYHTLKRNLSKRYGDANPWILETTTMYQPGQESIAEETYKLAHDIEQGRIKRQNLLFDHRYSALPVEELHDTKKLKLALFESYGSAAKSPDGKDYVFVPDGRMVPVDERGFTEDGRSLADTGVEPGPCADGWVDVRGQLADTLDPSSDVADSVRYYLNSLTSASDAWLTEQQVTGHIEFESAYHDVPVGANLNDVQAWHEFIDPSDAITLGFDGSLSDDATALVGCRVRDGLLFLIRLESKPERFEESQGWRVDVDAFDRAAREVMDEFNVVGFFADVAYWKDVIIGWENDYRDQLVARPRKGGDPIRFWTNNWKRDMMQYLVDMHTAFSKPWEPCDDERDPNTSVVALAADPRLVAHFRNARRKDFRTGGYLIYKQTPNSPDKIDACMAGVLAYAARMRYIESGLARVEDDYFIPRRLY